MRVSTIFCRVCVCVCVGLCMCLYLFRLKVETSFSLHNTSLQYLGQVQVARSLDEGQMNKFKNSQNLTSSIPLKLDEL